MSHRQGDRQLLCVLGKIGLLLSSPGLPRGAQQGARPSESLGPHSSTAWVWDPSFSASVPSGALSRGGLAPTVSGGLVCRTSHPVVVLASACFPRTRFWLLCQLQQKFQCAPGSRSHMCMMHGSPAMCAQGTRGEPISVQSSLGKAKHLSIEITVLEHIPETGPEFMLSIRT